jgi:FtsZ-interacting cell division protein ZipA
MWFLNLIGGIKGIAVILLIVAVGAWAFTQKRNVEKAELARDQAIAERDQAAVQRDKAIEAARVNEQTIARLEQEKELANFALNTLQQARDSNRTNTVTREVIIQNQASVPANAAQAAPVLGSIIEEIQADRNRRRGVPATTASGRPAAQKRILE